MKYSGITRRILAFAVDSLALLCIAMFLGMVLGLSLFAKPLASLAMIGFWFYGGLFLVSWIYFAGMESSPFQATLGKKLLGIQVANLKGERISFWRATGRYFGRILSRAFFFLGFITIFFTKRKQAVHDLLSSTVITRSK